MAEGTAKTPARAETSELVGKYPVLFGRDSDMERVLEENLGGETIRPLDLDRVAIPAGGGTSWEVPTLEGSDSLKDVEGIIVAWRSPRVYWALPIEETGGGSPPDCSSDDGVLGIGAFGPGSPGNPNGRCDQCPKNQWGSADPEDAKNRGKACKEMRQLFMLRPGGVLPLVLSLPPTSIAPLRKYFLRLASESTPYYGVVTAIALDKVVSGGFTYSVARPRMVAKLSPEELDKVRSYSDQFRPGLEATPVVVADDDANPDG